MERSTVTYYVVAALAAGIAAGTAAAVTATAIPYALGFTLNALQSKRRKESREHRHRLKEKVKRALSAVSKEGQNFREAILKGLVKWKDVDITFENFPYYLSEVTKTALLDSTFIHLKRPEYVKYTSELSQMSPRILLTGPPGSELYQEALVKALAHHMQVKLIIFDSTGAFLEASDSLPNNERRLQTTPASKISARNELVVPAIDAVPIDQPEASQNGSLANVERPSLAEPVIRSTSSTSMSGIIDFNLPSSSATSAVGSSSRSLRSKSSKPQEGNPLSEGTAIPLPSSRSSKSKPERTEGGTSLPLDSKQLSSATESTKRPLRKGDRVRYGGPGPSGGLAALRGSTSGCPPIGLKGRVLMVVEENPNKVGVRFDKAFYGGNNLVDLCEEGHGCFCSVNELRLEGSSGEDVDRMVVEALVEVLTTEAAKEPLLVFMRNVERAVAGHFERYMKLERLEKDVRIVIVGSHTVEPRKEKAPPSGANARIGDLTALLDLSVLEQISARAEDSKGDSKTSKMLSKLFPSRIAIQPPQDEVALREWNQRLEADAETLKADTNRQRLRMMLNAAGMECEGLPEITITTQSLTQDVTERIVGWGASHHLQINQNPTVRSGKLLISADSIQHSASTVQAAQAGPVSAKKSLKDVVCDNDFEKMLLSEVIPPDELGITFDHIGALDNVKETLRELVMLPLQRPELFLKGQLTKPVRGLLLFGPPGTGKTMLAKAVATEAGANFINISMSTIASKWFGEAEKYVKAVFTLASKIAPSVIFIDEVDSMLGRRGKENEHSAMRKVKNELMSSWDGLRTRERERVLVLAATNRPFDLDEAVIRRFPRRLMVDLPDPENRAKILKVILSEEEVSPDFNMEELAASTDSYSGSDLRNLCTTAAYRRIREILDKEKKEREKARAEGRDLPVVPSDGPAPYIRPLSMEDMRQAMEKVRSSVASDATSMLELTQWNEQYGEGGTRKTTPLSYFM